MDRHAGSPAEHAGEQNNSQPLEHFHHASPLVIARRQDAKASVNLRRATPSQVTSIPSPSHMCLSRSSMVFSMIASCSSTTSLSVLAMRPALPCLVVLHHFRMARVVVCVLQVQRAQLVFGV